MKTIVLECDDLDAHAIEDFVSAYQTSRRIDGELCLPDGDGDLRGRILAEICRSWGEYVVWFAEHERNPLTGNWEPKDQG